MVHCLKSNTAHRHWTISCIKETYNGWKHQMQIVIKIVAKLLQCQQQFNSNSPVLAGIMHENSQDLRHELREVYFELSPQSNSNVLYQ